MVTCVFHRSFVAVLVLFLIVSCATPQSDWDAAQKENSKYSYENFIKNYPDSDFANQAKAKIEELDWAEATRINAKEKYEEFIRNHPKSDFTPQARIKVETISWGKAAETNSILGYSMFMRKYPESSYVDKARLKIGELKYLEIIKCGKYGPLEKFINQHKDTEIAQKAISHSNRTFKVYTVKKPERVTFLPAMGPGKDEPGIVLEIKGTLYGEAKLDHLTLRSDYKPASANSGWGREFFMAHELSAAKVLNDRIRQVKKEIHQDLSDDFIVWCVVPEKVGDYLKHKGTIELQGAGKNISIPEFYEEKRKNDNFDVFAHNIESEKVTIYQDIIPIIYVSRGNSACGFSEIVKSTFVYKNSSTISAKIHSARPCRAQIFGNVRFEDDRWTSIKKGMDVKGGGLMFDMQGIWIMPGTKVAARKIAEAATSKP